VTREPTPFHCVLAFFEPLLRRAAPTSYELEKIDHELFRWQDSTIDPMHGT